MSFVAIEAYEMKFLIFGACACLIATSTLAEEIVVESIDLPGASMNQEVTYSSSRADYNANRDSILERMKAGDPGAFVNNPDPWKRDDTTATIGFAYKGIGSSSGRKNIRQISASEEALYLFEKKK